MSWFTITQTTHHRTVLPVGTDRAVALDLLHDHETMMHFGPHLQNITPLPTDPAYPDHTAYRVTDLLEMLPKSVWSSNVVSTYYYKDNDVGIDLVIQAPLGVLMNTTWSVQPGRAAEGEAPERLYVDESVKITCSRLLMKTVIGTCDESSPGLHARLIAKLQERQAAKEGKGAEVEAQGKTGEDVEAGGKAGEVEAAA